jgi:UDP-galactopyranose mutase
MKVNIVGCGLAGITSAVLLEEQGHNVTIFESRSHIGGNCHDSNLAGTLVHNYGPHLFHTNDEEVFKFLSRYTEWFDYSNKPKGNTKLGLISLPYSKKTVKELGREMTQEEIVDVIFKDYSEKQWGVLFDQIPKSITNRIPRTKDSEDPTWFEGEKYQCLPKYGYTKMMENMLTGIDVLLGCEDNEWKQRKADLVVYTGKIDQFYDYKFGRLPYRTLEFKHHYTSEKLPCAIINENTKEVGCTRRYDHSYFNLQHKGSTIVTEEYSKACTPTDVPFYPMPFGEGLQMYARYKELADSETQVIFAGRLATYTYMDMWMTVKQAMLKVKNHTKIC